MNKKLFWLITAILLALIHRAEAQQPTRIPRIGYLGNSTAALEENLVEPFRQGLHDLGYVEGKNILIEYRWAEGKYDRFPAIIGARVMEFATKQRLPGVYAYLELVEAGGLMSYGPSYADMHRRAATFVDKILKGAKAGDLPVEQPMKFELVINLKTAKQTGLTIPPNVLARADRVIK